MKIKIPKVISVAMFNDSSVYVLKTNENPPYKTKLRMILYFEIDNLVALHIGLSFTVQDQNKSSTGSTNDVGTCTLEQSASAFILNDLLEAVESAGVETLINGLLGLHLETTTDGVEWVGDKAGHDDGELSTGPLGGDTWS